MPSNRRISPLELYVIAYLKQHARKRIGLKFAQKALALVNEKLGIPCCDTPDATIDFHTAKESDFTNTVRMMLNAMPKTGNVASLNKTVTLLTNYITPPCCA